jgi:hypothetical protein
LVIKTLDPDWIRIGIYPKMLDPDPYQMNTDPQPWFFLLAIHPRILTLGFALIIVVLITGIFSFVQENKETEVRKEFDRLIPEKATVIR